MTIQTIYRSCPTCEASCGLVMEVDQQENKVLSIKGDPENHRSRGYVCAKSQAFRYIYEDPERLTSPVKKVDGRWQDISWEEALAETAQRLVDIRDRHGKDAIAMYYGNPNGHNFSTQIYTQMFITLLNTERFFSAGSVDQQPKNLSCELLYGNGWVFPIPDVDHSDFFVCMGGNPMVSQGSLMSAPDIESRLKGIQQRGGKVVVIDPRRTETADIADQHLFIRPGTDAFLLMAFVNELFATDRVSPGRLQAFTDGIAKLESLSAPYTPEAVAAITGVPADRLRQLVDDFCNASAPVLYGRIGLCTQQFGTLASWLVDVVNILTGRLDARGGAMFPRPATAHNDPASAPPELGYNRWQSKARGFPEYMGMLPASLMAEEMELQGEHQVRALITVAGNPVLSVPNGKRIHAAMDKLEFVVAFDFYINETTSQADIIIPSTTQLEHSNYDFLFSATCVRNFAQYSPPTFDPPDGALEQYQILNEVTARMNGMTRADLEAMMLDGLIDQLLSNAPDLSHLPAEDIKQQTAEHEGPERLLDIMLRAGPYGDKFGGEGLTLAQLKAAPHGIDLGPLEPRLPELLATPNKRINIVPDVITSDIPRLQAALDKGPSEHMLLIGRRHIRDMNSWLHNLTHYARGKNRCTLLINPQDAKRIGLTDSGKAKISSRVGEFEAEVTISDSIMPGVVSLPHGFGHIHRNTQQSVATTLAPGVSANDLVDDNEMDMPSGTSVVNGVPVTIVKATAH
ncbi:MAG: molybdopterin-dependent oxidoreductase [Halioglobus sp.]|nr:molybdopterin-dependent oxidoreductase [Halioglobus sp.]